MLYLNSLINIVINSYFTHIKNITYKKKKKTYLISVCKQLQNWFHLDLLTVFVYFVSFFSNYVIGLMENIN